jgi:lysophospholipase L1-like esterase
MCDRIFLFLGDSVTDCSRKRASRFQNDVAALGSGWVKLLHDDFVRREDSIELINRGYAGCRTAELRSQPDWWPEKLDDRVNMITLMIGINDIWHPLKTGESPPLARVLAAFDQLLEVLMQRADQVLVCEPVALPVGEVSESWFEPLNALTVQQQRICHQSGARWLPLQATMSQVAEGRFQDYLYDGVHPTDLGHRFLAEQWLSVFDV